MSFTSNKGVPDIASGTPGVERPEPLKSVPVKHYGQAILAVVILVFTASFIYSVATNPKLDFGVFFQYLTAEVVLRGIVVTFALTLISMTAGTLLGVLLAIARLSENRVLRGLSSTYIWFFRGVPLLVQILIWGNFALLFSFLTIGVPFTDIAFLQVPTNAVLTTFVAACIALSLHEAAYMAEVVRGGILGVDSGQAEAAVALGMTGGHAMRRIILPQAMRIILPPTGNQLITLFKSSSLVSIIAGQDLMTAVQTIGLTNYRVVELLFVGTFWYLVIVSVLTVVQRVIERRASRGYAR